MAIDDEQVARIAAKQMGEKPQENKEAPTTAQEKAVEVAAPETEGDKSQAEAIIYNVKIGDEERPLSPSQIAGTYERYRDLNFKQAQMKPVNDLAAMVMEKTGGDAESAAKLMAAGLKAMSKNAQMGKSRPKQDGVAAPVAPAADSAANSSAKLNEEWAKYEDENAISLPPGFKEMSGRMEAIEGMMGKMVNMNQQIMQQAMAAGQQGNQSREEAMQTRDEVLQQRIRNNLDTAQQSAGLPDEALDDFRAFALERGYTAEDFIDMDLTAKVVNDFKNQMNMPEFERVREMAAKREAFLKSQTGGATSEAAAPAQDDTLARLAQGALNKRMG